MNNKLLLQLLVVSAFAGTLIKASGTVQIAVGSAVNITQMIGTIRDSEIKTYIQNNPGKAMTTDHINYVAPGAWVIYDPNNLSGWAIWLIISASNNGKSVTWQKLLDCHTLPQALSVTYTNQYNSVYVSGDSTTGYNISQKLTIF